MNGEDAVDSFMRGSTSRRLLIGLASSEDERQLRLDRIRHKREGRYARAERGTRAECAESYGRLRADIQASTQIFRSWHTLKERRERAHDEALAFRESQKAARLESERESAEAKREIRRTRERYQEAQRVAEEAHAHTHRRSGRIDLPGDGLRLYFTFADGLVVTVPVML